MASDRDSSSGRFAPPRRTCRNPCVRARAGADVLRGVSNSAETSGRAARAHVQSRRASCVSGLSSGLHPVGTRRSPIPPAVGESALALREKGSPTDASTSQVSTADRCSMSLGGAPARLSDAGRESLIGGSRLGMEISRPRVPPACELAARRLQSRRAVPRSVGRLSAEGTLAMSGRHFLPLRRTQFDRTNVACIGRRTQGRPPRNAVLAPTHRESCSARV